MSRVLPRIAVLGSINMDLVIRCKKLPVPGQTILASSSKEICGGKGANQAVGAARAGGRVSMIGRVGDDAFADRLVDNLCRNEIDCRQVHHSTGVASGLAVVSVEDSGQNSIVVVPGANGMVGVEDVEAAKDSIASSDILLLQLEVPIPAVLAAIAVAKTAGVRVVLDPAPAPTEWPVELLQVDLICPNESEAASIVGYDVATIEHAESAARDLHERGARSVAITMGEQGVVLFDGSNVHHIPPFKVDAIDSTAAGDAFAGALGVRWSEGENLLDAVRFANAAGALAAAGIGAQPSMASRHEIERLVADS